MRLADCREQQCLVLRAEPGLGKTRAIEDAVAWEAGDDTEGADVRRVDLGAFDDTGLLHAALFEHESWLRWRDGDEDLELWLDSLDEAILHARSVEKFLSVPARRARNRAPRAAAVRLACRSADWSDTFGEGLALTVAGRSRDAASPACAAAPRGRGALPQAHGLDADAFVSDIIERASPSSRRSH